MMPKVFWNNERMLNEHNRTFEGFKWRVDRLDKAGRLGLCVACLRSWTRCYESPRRAQVSRSWKAHRAFQWRAG